MAGDQLVSLKVKEEKQSSSPTKVASTHDPSPSANGTNTQQKWAIVSTTRQKVKSLALRVVNPCEQVCLSPPSIKEVVSLVSSINRTFTITHHLDSRITDLPDGALLQENRLSGMILTSSYRRDWVEKFWRCRKRLFILRIGYPGRCHLFLEWIDPDRLWGLCRLDCRLTNNFWLRLKRCLIQRIS